jgi:hypothetical protein
MGFPADITNFFVINCPNAISVTARDTFRRILFYLFGLDKNSTPTTITTLRGYLSSAL